MLFGGFAFQTELTSWPSVWLTRTVDQLCFKKMISFVVKTPAVDAPTYLMCKINIIPVTIKLSEQTR